VKMASAVATTSRPTERKIEECTRITLSAGVSAGTRTERHAKHSRGGTLVRLAAVAGAGRLRKGTEVYHSRFRRDADSEFDARSARWAIESIARGRGFKTIPPSRAQPVRCYTKSWILPPVLRRPPAVSSLLTRSSRSPA
jgi:hypothetical protein